MRVRWKRGLLRLWVVLNFAWVSAVVWIYHTERPGMFDPVHIHVGSSCWDRLAKWPDGSPMDEWIAFGDEVDVPSNIERNKEKHEWAADDIRKRNDWRQRTRVELAACEASESPIKRTFLRIQDIWSRE